MRRLLPLLVSFCLLACAGALRAESYEAGLRALDAGRPDDALAIWTALAEAGDASAKYGLGRLYEVGGDGFAPDKAKAARWYRQAAEAGVVAAQNNLARLYARGDGIERDLAMAAGLWEQAAVRGHPTAQYNLGLLLLRGEGVEQDESRGAVWVAKAAESGVPAAQFVLGDLKRYGIGLAQDPDAALDWYRRAADAGYQPARDELARLESGGSELAAAPSPKTEVPDTKPGPPSGSPSGVPSGEAPGSVVESAPDAEPRTPAPPPDRPLSRSGKTPLAVSTASGAGTRAAPAGAEPPPRPSPPSPQLGLARAAADPVEASHTAAPEETGPASGESVFFLRPQRGSDASAPSGSETEAVSAVSLRPAPRKPAGLPRAAVAPAAAAAGAPAAPAAGPDGGAAVERPTPPSGRFGLWLGTAGDRDDADRLGRALSDRHGETLGAAPVSLRRVEVAGLGAVYRVFAGSWDARSEAEAACGRLRAADPTVFCSTVAY